MFVATFLGHQGWSVAAAGAHVLIDPLLTESFGHGGDVGCMYPPRALDFAAWPPVDAVFLTHEHDDHFDVPSLASLDPRIPVFLSGRASGAAWDLLRDLELHAHPLHPGDEVAVGELRYRALPAAHDGRSDEWDVLPFMIYDTAGDGSLLSSVDVATTEPLARAAAASGARPGIWCVANNLTAPEHVAPQPGDTERLGAALARRIRTFAPTLGDPPCVVITGNGWSFPGPRAWMNARVFPVDNRDLETSLASNLATSAATPGYAGHVVAPRPGDRVALTKGHLVRPGPPPADFVQALPQTAWPLRSLTADAAPDGKTYPIAPARPEDDPPDPAALAAMLQDFAAFLYGGPVFAALCSAPGPRVKGRRVGVCFDAQYPGGRTTLVYDPSRCRFAVETCDDPQAEFVSGWEVWAADLAAFLDGRLGASGLCHAGRMRPFNAQPDLVRVSAHDLWMFGHPLRRPDATARLYRYLREHRPRPAGRIRAGQQRVETADPRAKDESGAAPASDAEADSTRRWLAARTPRARSAE